jgi:hypothetical protein
MKIQQTSLSYKSGLTQGMKLEIAKTNPAQIQTNLAQHGINTDFKNNKFIAWASSKCFEFIDELNQKFSLNLGLPNGIFVENFNNIDTKNKDTYGFCNLAPSQLFINSDIKIPEKTIFFNSFNQFENNGENKKWNNLDKEIDFYKKNGISTTDFFMEVFLHEFFHVAHINHMINTLGGKKYAAKIENILNIDNLTKFQKKYYTLLTSICKYAVESPLESIACDMSKRAISTINPETLKPTTNFIEKSPYADFGILKRLFLKQNNLDKKLRTFWNGRFE